MILRRITLRNETRFNNDVGVGLRDRLAAQRSTGARPRGSLPAVGAGADSKTDADQPDRQSRYRRQVGWYVHAIEKRSGRPAAGFLLHL